MNTFEEILDLVTELPLEQQEQLIEIVKHRATDMRRKELANTSREALAEFRTGNLKAQTANEAIAELRTYLNSPEA
jgi:hypothetical protein